MSVRIADIFNPTTFGRKAQEAQLQLNRFLNSGIAVMDPELNKQFQAGALTALVNVYSSLAIKEPRYSNDDPSDLNTTHGKIDNLQQTARVAARNDSWALMRLARELADADPVGAITNRIGQFWASDDEQRLLTSLLGILADNVANDGSDMLVDVSTDAAGAVADAERIGGDLVIDGLQTMGDHKDALTALAIHSQIHSRLQKQNLIEYIPATDSTIAFQSYLGRRLIVDDTLPAVAGTNRITYTCVMFGPGAVLAGSGKVAKPSELDSNPDAGNGGGQDKIYSRVSNAWHPNGFNFTSTTVAGQAPTYAELNLAANWDRIMERKHIPIAFLKVND
tara:strand:- start:4379 stop:5386 length:1008 start_codon:yes stop_codon:yes gene_type:complete